jgi:predicted NUDIX family NTP pyrophosphohydrolase
MPEISAGILLHRARPSGRELLLVHPGGPFWARKDAAAWSIPKGLIDPGEDREAAARREFSEEVGAVPGGALLPLGEFRLSSAKLLVAFALEGDFDPQALVSNSFELEWPPRSGRLQSFPEVDRAEWFGPAAAREKLHLGQRPLIDALLAAVER